MGFFYYYYFRVCRGSLMARRELFSLSFEVRRGIPMAWREVFSLSGGLGVFCGLAGFLSWLGESCSL